MVAFDDVKGGNNQDEVARNQRSLILQAATAAFTPIHSSPITFKSVNSSRPHDSEEGDIHDLSENPFREPPKHKKRKTNTSTPIQLNFLSDRVPAAIWDGDASSHARVSKSIGNLKDSNATQLSTPSHSTMNKTRRVYSKQSELLPQYAITKPSDILTKWTTTEDSVKAMIKNCIAETTLEKLAAFGYQESRKKAQGVLMKRTVNLFHLDKHPASLFDQEFEATTHALPDQTEPPTRSQPLGWSFSERVSFSSDDLSSRNPVIEPNIIQSSSSSHVLDSDHIEPIPGLIEDERLRGFYHTADFDANPECVESRNKETIRNIDNRPISNKFESLLESTSCCEGSPGYEQNPSLWGEEISQENVEKIVGCVEICRRSQQSEPAPLIPTPLEDEFPFDEEDEAELVQLQVQPISADDITHFPSFSSKITRHNDLLKEYRVLPERVTPFSRELLVGFQALADAHDSTPVNREHELQRTKKMDDSLAFHGQEEIIPSPLPMDLQVVNSNEYAPLDPFARPDFPLKVRDRSSIPGLSADLILKTCFRIGEAVRASVNCNKAGLDGIIELFARVTESSRESGSVKQHFEFADLFHDRPPHPKGVLENYKIFALQETESCKLLGSSRSGQMVRCLGRLKRDYKYDEWMLYIINIRLTDWEEVRWTKGIAGAGMIRSEGSTQCPKL